jgi:hypothetical protein
MDSLEKYNAFEETGKQGSPRLKALEVRIINNKLQTIIHDTTLLWESDPGHN